MTGPLTTTNSPWQFGDIVTIPDGRVFTYTYNRLTHGPHDASLIYPWEHFGEDGTVYLPEDEVDPNNAVLLARDGKLTLCHGMKIGTRKFQVVIVAEE